MKLYKKRGRFKTFNSFKSSFKYIYLFSVLLVLSLIFLSQTFIVNAYFYDSTSSFSNSVIGARTNREGGPSALAAAICGKTPKIYY